MVAQLAVLAVGLSMGGEVELQGTTPVTARVVLHFSGAYSVLNDRDVPLVVDAAFDGVDSIEHRSMRFLFEGFRTNSRPFRDETITIQDMVLLARPLPPLGLYQDDPFEMGSIYQYRHPEPWPLEFSVAAEICDNDGRCFPETLDFFRVAEGPGGNADDPYRSTTKQVQTAALPHRAVVIDFDNIRYFAGSGHTSIDLVELVLMPKQITVNAHPWWPGDANCSGAFDQLDVVAMLKGSHYGESDNPATWEEGDFNGDGYFDQLDIVAALQTGTYLHGPYMAAVPEPPSDWLIGSGLILLFLVLCYRFFGLSSFRPGGVA
jgi:hypothetical protein